jgi:hypothetical protein
VCAHLAAVAVHEPQSGALLGAPLEVIDEAAVGPQQGQRVHVEGMADDHRVPRGQAERVHIWDARQLEGGDPAARAGLGGVLVDDDAAATAELAGEADDHAALAVEVRVGDHRQPGAELVVVDDRAGEREGLGVEGPLVRALGEGDALVAERDHVDVGVVGDPRDRLDHPAPEAASDRRGERGHRAAALTGLLLDDAGHHALAVLDPAVGDAKAVEDPERVEPVSGLEVAVIEDRRGRAHEVAAQPRGDLALDLGGPGEGLVEGPKRGELADGRRAGPDGGGRGHGGAPRYPRA